MNQLRELIADRIRTSGPISFAEFMELSLYHPELGYYARAAQKTGRAGDFFTSVDVGPIFGELLARQFGEMWRSWGLTPVLSAQIPCLRPRRSGRRQRPTRARRARRRTAHRPGVLFRHQTFARRAITARRAPRTSDTLGPHAALLTHSSSGAARGRSRCHLRERVARRAADPRGGDDGERAARSLRQTLAESDNFVERLQDPSTPRIADYLSRAGAVMPKGARAEVNLAAEDWVKKAAKSLRRGFMLLIDYGHRRSRALRRVTCNRHA